MAILIKCENASGQVAIASGLVEGCHTEQRIYDIVDGFVTVEHDDPVVVNHDADEILKMEGFSIASPSDQEASTSSKRKSSKIKE
jgi:hypothetical protein